MRHAGLICALVVAATGLPAQAPVPSLLVLNKSAATLSIIDAGSGRTLATVATGDGPHEVAATGDGRLAFVTNYGSRTPGNTLSVIDLAGRTEARRVDLGALRQPHGVVVVDGKALFTAEGARSIARYDPVANRIDWRFETGQEVTHMIVASADGRTLFTSNLGSNTISVIENTGEQWRQTLVRVGAGPEGLDLSPDGRELWTAHSRDGGVSVIDVASRKVVQTIDAGTRRSNRLKFTPDGALVLVSDLEAGDVVVIDAKSRRVTRRLPVGRMVEGILMGRDGRLAYVAVTGEDRVAVVDLQKMEIVRTLATGAGPDGMAWSVD